MLLSSPAKPGSGRYNAANCCTSMKTPYPILSPQEAAVEIQNGQTVAFSGFTPAGAAKSVPGAIAERALAEHAAGRPYAIGVITGASTGPSLDGVLAAADAVSFRTPFQSDPRLRQGINEGRIRFFDMHLSQVAQAVRAGVLGRVDWAVIEACDVTPDGEITLTSAVGAAPTFCAAADRIIIELNRSHPPELRGFHDIYEPRNPPHREPIPILRAGDRIGAPGIRVDPRKIMGIVPTSAADEVAPFRPVGPVTERIGHLVADFFAAELRRGALPPGFLPLQSGVGDTANAVLLSLGDHPDIPPFEMYTEVVQDAVLTLLRRGKMRFASTCSLTVSPPVLREIYADLEFYRPRLLLRPQEITNSPEIIRRLGVLAINTALEVDIGGNVNSTHVLGRNMMNGIGGSGDFARNAYLCVFTCPSTAKDGRISTLVPMVSHLDSSEHSVQVVITEQGVADLRGKCPAERARLIIEHCAHPDYKQLLRDYVALAGHGHSPQTLKAAFGLHQAYAETGDMRRVDWSKYR